jgi:hypothetical protein
VHYEEGLIVRLPPLPDDDLRLPDLQAWIGFFGGYDKISPEAWEQWDRLYTASRQLQKLEGREARLP